MEDEDLEIKIEQTAEKSVLLKQEEEEKAEKKWEENIIMGMSL
jgi:hypothetical protein